MFKKLLLLYHTVKHLKPIQIKYQLWYRLKKAKSLSAYRTPLTASVVQYLKFTAEPPVYPTYFGENKFEFLNKEYDFGKKIDWRFQEYGALWNYNLQYLNMLLQKNIELPEKLRLLDSVYSSGITLEPYPVALRSINAMRLLSKENIQKEELLEKLYAELNFLSKRLEFHLLGNHLLENVFALMMGGAFFNNKKWIKTAQNLLQKELKEQILSDGAHFELSPMYHQIIFFRLLELIDWYSGWEKKQTSFEAFLREKAAKMSAWLKNISFKNGDIPHFNDSASGIAYSTPWLCEYADQLGIKKTSSSLSDSGYRKKDTPTYEIRIDGAQIGPSYQPGHAHADALNFILYQQGEPLLVEQGTSTYDIGAKRREERSTKAHNTVVVKGQSQSQVWSGFRVGKRAQTQIIKDTSEVIQAEHDGYQDQGTLHRRTFQFSAKEIQIRDELTHGKSGKAYFHLHPEYEVYPLKKNIFALKDNVRIQFSNFAEIQIEPYEMADGYNKYKTGKRLVISFTHFLNSKIVMS